MVFRSDRQRKAAFANMNNNNPSDRRGNINTSDNVLNRPMPRKTFFRKLKLIREEHRKKVQVKLQNSIIQEQKELKKIQSDLRMKQEIKRLRLAREEQLKNQREQLDDLRRQQREAKRKAFELTSSGRVLKLIRKGATKVTTSKQTQSALKKIRKSLLS